MSSQVVVEVVGQAKQAIVLDEGDAVLVGREPDAARIAAIPGDALRLVTVAQPSVSANHLLVSREADATSLIDTTSRNGSWLRLPAGDRVEVRSSKPLHVRLSMPPDPAAAHDGPRDATWLHRDDFHTGVAAAVTAWLEELGLASRVSFLRDSESSAEDRMMGRLPLANGFRLDVVPTRTVDAAWDETLEVLWRYVNTQNAIFQAEEETRSEGLILASPAIRHAHQQVVSAAQRGFRLLLIGPSGAGKDGLARCYHRHSRRGGAFVAKNCSMLSRDLLRAELFGAEQGSFTTAVRRIVGAVEACHGGTLFLDEIGDMPSDVQPLLLTFLDRGEYERMGSYDTMRTADVRLVCATNKDLRAATLRGEFRQDLWYRIAGQVVHVPPLRDRPADIEAFLKLQSPDGRCDQWTALDPAARALVLSHAWDGNFRELFAFSASMPRNATPHAVRIEDCRALLAAVALTPPSRSSSPPPSIAGHGVDVALLAGEAAQQFVADSGHGLVRWDDVKECIERYLKPLLFAEMTGAHALEKREHAVIPALAGAIDADRGTAVKHLNRYFERFKK
ncbi:MAG TPA: sigma 54-interacting transcriptional regulator [Kofleriaceae bacterium]|nr:sigma 54-interacting transcriptional regulator [Kofleriaceae bacterium]